MDKDNKTSKVENDLISDDEGVVKEVELPKRKIRLSKVLLYIAIGCFAIYAVYSLVTQYEEINRKQEKLKSLESQITVQEIKNEELTNIYNLSDKENEEYIEQKAKEDGYLHAGERVFVNISGD